MIVDAAIYDKFVPMVAEKTKALKIGPPEKSDAQIGPVVNESAMKKIKEYIEDPGHLLLESIGVGRDD